MYTQRHSRVLSHRCPGQIWLVAAFCCVCLIGSAVVSEAAICFLPDCESQKSTEGRDTGADACLSAGFESDKSILCNQYSIVSYCPQNSNYIKCNDELWCNVNGYTLTSCEYPNELFNKCPNGLAMYKECKPNMEDICKNENPAYVESCPAGWTLDPNNKCTYSSEWGECCNMCPGYEYTESTLPAGQSAVASCQSCDGMRYIAGSIGNICEGFWDCQDGCEVGSETCASYNGVIKCKVCKRCEAKCSNIACPPGALCEYENCTQRYCDPTGCALGYSHLCETPETNCALLGYDTYKGHCDGMGEIDCPFDEELVWCIPDNGDCCRELCEGFDYEYSQITSGYVVTGSCSCCGKNKFKISENACAGFVDASTCDWGAAEEASTCLKGTKLLHSACKNCPNATANRVCPWGYICTKDDCSGTYIVTGCASGFDNFCNTPNLSCENMGYNMTLDQCAAGSNILYCPYDTYRVICDSQEVVACEYYCNAYPYQSIPEGYVQTSSRICCGTTYYQADPAPCEGFYHDDECKFGADKSSQTCLSGTETMYASCNECTVCLPRCPAGAACNFDTCSETFCPTGCAVGYENYCNISETDCSSLGYSEIAKDCTDKNILRCPYNTSHVICD